MLRYPTFIKPVFLLSLLFFFRAEVSYCATEKTIPFNQVVTIAGNGAKGRTDGTGSKARFNWPTGVSVAADGTIFVADYSNNLIRRIEANGDVVTFAGTGKAGYKDGTGVTAELWGPDTIDTDGSGNIYVGDADNLRIRKIDRSGVVRTVAGSGASGYSDGDAGAAMFGYPTGVAVDRRRAVVFVADRRTHTIRAVTDKGMVMTIAGNGNPGYVDGRKDVSLLNEPVALAVGPDGDVYVADSGNNAVRRITFTDDKDMARGAVIITIAGGRTAGYANGVGRLALFSWPTGIAIDAAGNVYVCDSRNNKIRRIAPSGAVSTVAGLLSPGFSDAAALKASFNFPTGIAVAKNGDLYVADSGNNAIRKITSAPR